LAPGGYYLDLSLSSFLFDYVKHRLTPLSSRGNVGTEKRKFGFMKPQEEIRKTRYKTYVIVWITLVILTGVTLSAAGMELGGWTVLIALAIAGTKSGLVLNYFMHLRSERLLIFKIIIPLVMVVFLVFIILTFSDLAFRGGVK
jgi:cytochrome c oxidase subunit 4